LKQCVRNITGRAGRIWSDAGCNDDGGGSALFCSWSYGGDQFKGGGGTGVHSVGLNAARQSGLYRDNCNAIRPKSFGVYIWKRKE